MALTDSLQGYWTLDEASGTRLDSTANNNDLTDNNTVAAATGKINNGADFEFANSEWLSITDAAQTGLDIVGDIAVSFWYNQESEPAQDTESRQFIAKFGGSTHSYFFYYLNNGGTRQLVATLYPSGDAVRMNTTLSNATWYHIVFSYVLSTGTCTFYLNGTSLGATAGGGTSINNSDSPFNIGARNGAANTYVDGIMDEVGIWSRVLTSGEVTELYNGGAGLAYPFGAASGPANLKSYNTNLKANIKSIDTNLIANTKSLDTNV